MRPMLLPALRGLWRDTSTWQIGVDPSRAVQLTDVDRRTASLIASLDGSRDLAQLRRVVQAQQLDPDGFTDLVGQLCGAGVVVDAAARTRAVDRHTDRRRRLEGDVLAMSLRYADPERVVRDRAERSAVVAGHTRLTVPVAAHLATAGLGRVHVATSGDVLAADALAGGTLASDEHQPRARAAAAAIARAAPEVDSRALPPAMNPDLVVLTDGAGTPPDELTRLHDRGVAHLLVSTREDRGFVGPLVLPGATACQRCADLHRADRDPAWPLLLAQLAGEAPGSRPCDVPLAATLVALTVTQTLAYLDGDHCDAVEGCLEVLPPGYRVRRRSFPPHPRCGCVRPARGIAG